MVSADYMIRAALRHDTAMSRAMLVPHARPRIGSIVAVDAYDGLGECFANHGSPMDRMI